jgi:hypothetical protein
LSLAPLFVCRFVSAGAGPGAKTVASVKQHRWKPVTTSADEAWEYAAAHAWPGNL